MKDIYDFFNDVNIKPEETITAEVDELEKARVKKRVQAQISAQGRVSGKRKGRRIAIAAALVLAVGLGSFGLAFPSYAKEVPVVGDIFRFLDQGRTGIYDVYEERAKDIELTKADKGVELTLNQGIYDGRTLTLTYTIKTEEDLGENPSLQSDLTVAGLGLGYGLTGTEQIERVDSGVYVGQSTYTLWAEKDPPQELDFRWDVKGMANLEQGKEGNAEMACDLAYRVSLEGQDAEKMAITAAGDTEQNVTIRPTALSATAVNTILYYREEASWDFTPYSSVEWRITDDLGNEYSYQGNGGYGNVEDGWMDSCITFKNLAPGAKKLYVTPVLTLATFEGGGVAIDESGKETVESFDQLPIGVEAGTWELQQITVDLSALQ